MSAPGGEDGQSAGVWRLATAAAVLAAAALAAANVWFGPLNHDEGWYLLAAQNVARGMRPYRDFLYTQGPVMPSVYGFLSGLWSPAGVLGGRVLTALLGLFAAGLFSAAAAEIAGKIRPGAARPAGFFAFVLLALSPDWAYFSSIPKTYALGAFFLGGGFANAVALFCRDGLRNRPAVACCAGACFALAAATRETQGLAAVPVWLALVAAGFRRGGGRRLDGLWFACGVAAALCMVYARVFAEAGGNFVFSQTYHAARASAPAGRWLVLRAAFVCFLAQGYPAFVAAAALLAATAGRGPRPAACGPAWLSAAAAFALLTLAHFFVPFPYADYNTPAMPFAAVALAVPLALRVARSGLRPAPVAAASLAASALFVAASPWPMKWAGGRQDRFWFAADPTPALARLREAGRIAKAANPGGKPMLAQDAYLAVEAGVPVVPGLDMGPFSVFPDLDDETARARRVHNLSTLEEAIRGADCDVAAIGGYTFAMKCPSTEPVDPQVRETLLSELRSRFPSEVASWDRFGQQDTPLEIRKR